VVEVRLRSRMGTGANHNRILILKTYNDGLLQINLKGQEDIATCGRACTNLPHFYKIFEFSCEEICDTINQYKYVIHFLLQCVNISKVTYLMIAETLTYMHASVHEFYEGTTCMFILVKI